MTLSMPYREDAPRTRLAFSLSVLMHILLVAAVALFLWHQPHPAPPPPKVFELVAGPPEDSTTDSATSTGLTQPVFQNLSPTPNMVEEQPQSQAQPQPATTPPANVKPATVKNVVPVTPQGSRPATKTPDSPGKITDLRSFQQSHPAATTPASTAPVRRGTAPNVGINVNHIVNSATGGGSGAAHNANSHAGAGGTSDDYVAKLIVRLHDAFVTPGGVSNLKADVKLTIASDGTVISALLVRSSGNDQFDAAVNDALRRLTHVDPPPGGQQISYTFTYQPNGI